MRPELRLDLLVAVVLAVIVLLVTPGLAFAGAIALLLLLAYALSVIVARSRARRLARRPGGGALTRRPTAPPIRLGPPRERAPRRRR